jgi:hypothetical protein
MKVKKIYYDERWLGNYGIGHVAECFKLYLKYEPLRINCSKLSVLDFILITFKILHLPKKAIIINPGFNCPFYNFKNYFFYISMI